MYTISFDQTQKKERTQLVLKRVTSLSPVPKILAEVLELLKDLNTSPHTLAKAITKDQSIVVKILTIANSPFYGLAKRVSSIEYAIMILGFNEIRNIVTALSLMESMKNKSDEYMDQKSFWLHSYITATTAKKIADDMNIGDSNDAFIGGLLHDLGISVIHRYMHTDFVAITDNVKKGMKYLEAENFQLGMDHQSIGYSLLKNWNIPESICEIVKYHHTPQLATNTKILASVVNFADYMTQKLQIGKFNWDDDMELSQAAAEILQFKELDDIEKFINMYREPLILQLESLRYLI